MKHRSVIAFVIVVAALFAAPQLSHDLQEFKSALGARLRGEILNAFLSLPVTEGTAAPAPRPARTLLASCTESKAGAPAAKSRKGEAAASPRAEARTREGADVQLAVAADIAPEVWTELAEGAAGLAFVEAAGRARAAGMPTEVAMIIPPGSGIEPRGAARVSELAAREGATQMRKLAQETRVAFEATRVEGQRTEWVKAGEALRTLDESLAGGFELRVGRDGAKTKVLKVRRGPGACCPAPAPRAPRTPGHVAAGAAPPADGESAPSDGE